MRRSLFLKIFAGYLVIVLILSGLILLFSFNTLRTHYIETLTNGLRNLALALTHQVPPLLAAPHQQELNNLVTGLRHETNTRITIIDAKGVVLADSNENPKTMENHRNRPEVALALTGTMGTSIRFSSTANAYMLYVALPVERDGTITGAIRVSMFLKDIDLLLATLKGTIARIVFAIVLLSLFGALLIARSLSNPIKQLTAAARRLASGDFSVRVFLKKKDEFQELADSFNQMSEEMANVFSQLTSQKEELDSVIHSLQEGLVVLDQRGKIVQFNESFKRAVQGEPVEGRSYWEVFRKPQLTELIERARRERRNVIGEAESDDKTYLCSVTLLDSKEKMVVILHDITELKRVEKVKRDFVINVSHELRTPLTAIKGFVETLETEVDEQNRHYVDIIKRNTERLVNIVNDLLLLSGLEERGTRLHLEEVDLVQMLDSLLRIFQPRLAEKGLSFGLEIAEPLPPVSADPFRLEQVFINLLDNAIKYTEKGEIKVSLKSDGGRMRIEVRDTGIGIPKEELPRIFERFYVVDKSRSKRLGGTGLGLSIVKHIVLLHNGTIDVESSVGIGTKFTITLPASKGRQAGRSSELTEN